MPIPKTTKMVWYLPLKTGFEDINWENRTKLLQ